LKSSLWYRLLLGGAALLALSLAVKLLPLQEWMASLLAWIQTLGPAAPAILVLVYVVACVLLVPGTIITLGAGFLFGLVEGYAVVAVGSVVGSTAAFLIGRTVARNWMSERVKDKPKFKAIDEAVGRRGLYIVFLTRLSPLFPFTLINYFYGITAVSLRDYVLASWVGMIPGTLMYVYLGTVVKDLAELAAGGGTRSAGTTYFLWFGLAATVAVAVMVARVAKRALDDVIEKGTVSTDGVKRERSHA